MENITSRKNRIICHFRSIAGDREYRYSCGEYVCDGLKTLREALHCGAQLCCVLWKEKAEEVELPESVVQYTAPAELFEYASPLKSSGGPVFTVKMPKRDENFKLERAIVLENLQDPGNVGTVIRTANAFNIDAVILVGACADLYNPKTVRASMGALFHLRLRRYPSFDAYAADAGKRSYYPFMLQAQDFLPEAKQETPYTLIFGNEATGLPESFLGIGHPLKIPQTSLIDSLNLDNAVAIALYEFQKETMR